MIAPAQNLRPRSVLATLMVQLSVLASVAQAGEADVVDFSVFPPEIHLSTSRDRQSFVAQVRYADGVTEDVTAAVQVTLPEGDLVALDGHVLQPRSDGEGKATFQFRNRSVSVPVTVTHSGKDRPISFKLDVMPVFMKGGCNSGSCHGAARGKDGFHLSLFGYDPNGDYHRLTREMNGRRINLALVDDSLILEKGAGRVAHTGGKRFDEQGELYDTVRRWLVAGAPQDANDIAKPTGIEFYPPNGVLAGDGAKQQLVIRASYSDGTTRDVTHLAYFLSSNDRSASVTAAGLITAGVRGEAFVMARFETFTVGGQFIVLPKGLEFVPPSLEENNYIDTLVHAKLGKLRVLPSELCSDEVFLRRVYIDIAGMLPTPEEYRQFIANENPNKRAALVDQLLQRKEFVELWVMKWAELLRIRSSRQVSYKATLLYYNWLQSRIAGNVPMDQLVRELLGSQGGTFKSPATNYYQTETDTLKVAENVAQVFMGMRIQCAQCHNHPFDRWTQDDYYGFAAFFSQVGRKRGEDPRETVVFNRKSGDVRHAVDKRVMAPKFLGGATPELNGRDRRVVLAEWLASPENPFFARNLANIVWAHFFGRGIIDEVDDVRVSNPPVNPELLEALAQRFTEYKYDFRKLVRDICTSRAYQRATQTNESNETDTDNFSHMTLRRIRAEVLLDCLSIVTDTKNKFRGLPLGARAVQIADGATSNYFLTTFGRATRETVCSCEVSMEPNLSQALHLLNGDTVARKIRQGGLIRQRLEEKKSPREIIEELYVRCFTRQASEEEAEKLLEFFVDGAKTSDVLEDIFWSLLNSREFLFNH